jgi:hypothetical protein
MPYLYGGEALGVLTFISIMKKYVAIYYIHHLHEKCLSYRSRAAKVFTRGN